MVKEVTIIVTQCTCEQCGAKWTSRTEEGLPTNCPKCRSRKWNGLRKSGRPPGPKDNSNAGLPKPKRVRNVS